MFARFKVYGVPSISSLLCKTGQFSNKNTVDKPYADTGCLLLESVLNAPASPRAIEAISRINYLNTFYRANGKINDEDMLYALSLFALAPSRWVADYEWRKLSDLERCAVGTLWKSLGEALGVNHDVLPGSRTGWKDGMNWLQYLDLWKLPERLQRVGEKVIAAILEDKLREAMMIQKSSQCYDIFIRRFVDVQKFFLLHLSLRRRQSKKRLPVATSSGRILAKKYLISSWYVEPTLNNKWGFGAWSTWLQGGILPGGEGNEYFPQGFMASELGSDAQRSFGKEKMEAERRGPEVEMSSEKGKRPFLRSSE